MADNVAPRPDAIELTDGDLDAVAGGGELSQEEFDEMNARNPYTADSPEGAENAKNWQQSHDQRADQLMRKWAN
ncbi:hypothetical protein [Streptomyces lunalinharesii]|uniref:Uncharacterized protein n=1 Tax=Streptomyces lunalinharesii TaxID=333384 RepID=A0ABP6F328_9ACTN